MLGCTRQQAVIIPSLISVLDPTHDARGGVASVGRDSLGSVRSADGRVIWTLAPAVKRDVPLPDPGAAACASPIQSYGTVVHQDDTDWVQVEIQRVQRNPDGPYAGVVTPCSGALNWGSPLRTSPT
jgi:hypothetical protein